MKQIFLTLFLLNSIWSFSQTDTICWDLNKLDSVNNVFKDGYHIFKNSRDIVQEGNYKDNCAVGTWKYYYSDGNIELLVDYICNGSGRSDEYGRYVEYYNSGQIKIEGRYEKFENDSIKCVLCYDRRQFKKIEWAESSPSLKVGEWKEYYENGKIKSIGKYYSGVHQTFNIVWKSIDSGSGTVGTDYLRDDEWKYFNENEELVKIEYYKQGTLIGEETFN